MSLFRMFQPKKAPKRAGWVVIDEDACTGCALCLPVCPMGGLTLADESNVMGVRPVRFTLDRCRGDAFCSRACPEPGVITVRHSRHDAA